MSQPEADNPQRSDSPKIPQHPVSAQHPSSKTHRGRRPTDHKQNSTDNGLRRRAHSAPRTRNSMNNSMAKKFHNPYDEDLEDIERYQRSPGPVYETGSIKDKWIFRHSFAANFGSAGRDRKSTISTVSPGPEYYPKMDGLSSFQKSPRATIGKAPRSFSVGREAAAADAVISLPALETISRHSFHASFGTEKRLEIKKDQSPGPGAYSTTVPEKKPTSTRGTFSHSKRGAGAWIFS